MSGKGRKTVREDRDGSRESLGCLRQVGGPSESFGKGRGTLGEVWDGSRDI